MEEIWKDVLNYEGLYQVSNLGRVKSLERTISAGIGNNHKFQHLPERILKTRDFGKYTQVILSKDGKTHCFSVHRLVAQAFIPNPDNLPCVNHIDEIRTNNIVTNLEWCTYKYNNEYNDRIGKCKAKISAILKSKQCHHKMTPEQIEHIRQGANKGWKKRRKSAITKWEKV